MQKHVARAHAIGAPKATVQAGGRNLQAPECEIRKIDVKRSFRVMREIAPPNSRAVRRRAVDFTSLASECDAGMCQRIALAGRRDQQGAAGIGIEVLCVGR